jgi:hypothetical protein
MKIIRSVQLFLMKIWWNSWYGKAIIHASFDKYKNSTLFKERMMYFGAIKAAKMFKWNEFKLFRKKIIADKKLMFTILLKPYKMYKEFEEKSYVLKSYVNL